MDKPEKKSERKADGRRPDKRPERRLEPLARRREKKTGEERARLAARLDTPREVRRSLVRRPTVKQDAFGIFAERFARFMGTARFLIYMTMFVIIWVVWNLLAPAACAGTTTRSSSSP